MADADPLANGQHEGFQGWFLTNGTKKDRTLTARDSSALVVMKTTRFVGMTLPKKVCDFDFGILNFLFTKPC